MIQDIQQFTEATEPIWQWLIIMLASAIPFIESYFGSALGVLAGVPVIIAIIAAIIGNTISMILLVTFGEKIRVWRKADEKPLSKSKERIKRLFNKYGVIGVSLLGQTLLPSQITSLLMVTFGAPKQKVIFWQIISIILWGTAFGLLAHFGVNVLNK